MSKKYTLIFNIILCLVPFFAFGQQADVGLEQLPPVDTLVQMAIRNSKRVQMQTLQIATVEQASKVRKLDWMEGLSVYSNAAYGNSTTASLNSTVNDQNQLNTFRTDLFANVGLSARLTLGTIVKKPQIQQLERLRIEMAEAEKELYTAEIRMNVVHLYDDLNMTIRSLPSKAENVEAFRLSLEIAERYFKEGTLEVGSYTMILAQKIKAEEEVEKTKSLARLQLHELQLLTGWRAL